MITPQRIGTHDENSHSNDKSVFLNHKQIKAVSDAVVIAPNTSAAIIRYNLLNIPKKGCIIGGDKLCSVQYHVRVARIRLTTELLNGFAIDDSFGSYKQFAEMLNFKRLVDQHNDPLCDFHFGLFEPVVIG